MKMPIAKSDIFSACILFLFPLLLFASVTLGPQTLLPLDNRFSFEPYASFREDFGLAQHPHNHLLSDLILENYIWKDFIIEALRGEEFPLWNPYLFAGQPFLANGQHSALYPFSLLFYLLPLSKAYGWFTLFHFWLAGIFTYIFLRILGADRQGAILGGLVFSLSTFFVTRVVFTMVIAGAVWLPLILAIIEIIIRKQAEKGPHSYSPMPYIALGVGAMGLQVLAGHIEITYYTLLVSAFYTAFRLSFLWYDQRTIKPALRLGVWLVIMMTLGLGLGAVQFIPFYEIGSANFREGSASLEQVQAWALPLRRAITFIIPHFFGSSAHHNYFDLVQRTWLPFEYNAHGKINPLCPYCSTWDIKTSVEAGAYVGLLPLILAGCLIWSVFQGQWLVLREQYRITLIFALLALLSLLFAFGSPLYALLFYGLPGWNQLHSPFRWIYPFTLSIAVLAGLGYTYLTKQRISPTPGMPKLIIYGLLGLGSLGLIGTGIVYLIPQPFVILGQFLVDRSGLAQNSFAHGQQFLSYQWPRMLHFWGFLFLSGGGLWFMRRGQEDKERNGPPNRPKRGEKNSPLWGTIPITIVAADLLIIGWGFNPSTDTELLNFTPPAVQWLQSQQANDPLFRVTSFDTTAGRGNKMLNANLAMEARLYDVRGYDSVILGQYHQFMQLIQPNGDGLYNRVGPVYAPGYDALDSALLDLLGVRYVLTTEDIPNPGYQQVYNQEVKIYENLDVMPRAYRVQELETNIDNLNIALRSLNPQEKLILDGVQTGRGQDLNPDQAIPLIANPNNQADVTIIDYGLNTVLLEAHDDQPAWLVLADTYFSGWRAYVRPLKAEANDEIEVPIHRANGNFRAIFLPAGSWVVRFYYAPLSFRLGLYVSFLAGMTVLFLGAYWSWGKLYRETQKDSAIKRIAKNSLVPMVLALSNRVIDFAFALLMLRILQPAGAGRYAFAVTFISLAEIFIRYGLGTLITRDVASDHRRANRYLTNALILRLYLWLAALPCLAAILLLYLFFGKTSIEVIVTVVIFSIGTLLGNISDGFTAIFYAHEKAEYPAAISSVTTLTRVALGALVLLLGWGIIGLAGASLVANVVAFLALGLILIRKIYRPALEGDKTLRGEMLFEGFPLMINHLLSTIFFRIDVFILEPSWGEASVGFYNAAYKYVDGINVIPQYFTLAIFPRMSKFAADSQESLIRAYVLSLRFLLIMALPIAMGTPFIAHELILFLAGERFTPDSVIVLQLLIWFLPFSFINQVTQYVLIAINQQQALTRAFLIGVGFNLMANLIFIPFYGYRAAAITTILSEWALLIPFYILIRQHLCAVPWLDIAWRPALAAGGMGLTLWLLGDLNFLLTVVVGGGIYFGVLMVVGGLKQKDMEVVWRTIPTSRKFVGS